MTRQEFKVFAKLAGWTYAQTAERIGRSPRTVANYAQHGNIPEEVADKIRAVVAASVLASKPHLAEGEYGETLRELNALRKENRALRAEVRDLKLRVSLNNPGRRKMDKWTDGQSPTRFI